MTQAEPSSKNWSRRATERLLAALNRADELGGELRDFLQDKVATDPRYVKARKAVAKIMGQSFESRAEAATRADQQAAHTAAVAAVTPATKDANRLGDPAIKAQIYGKKSCPWSGRAITLLERHKVDFDFIDLEEPEHEGKLTPLTLETRQHTVPFIFLRGQFIGGFNALSEIDRLGQLEFALMTTEQRNSAPAHLRSIEIVPRPNTDEVAPAETESRSEPAE